MTRLSLEAILLSVATLAILGLVTANYVVQHDALSPGVLLSASYGAYTLILPLSLLLSKAYLAEEFHRYIYAQMLGTAGMALGTVMAVRLERRGGTRVPRFSSNADVSAGTVVLGGLVWVAVGWLMMVLLVMKFGGLQSYLGLGYSSAKYVGLADSGYLGFGIDWLSAAYTMILFVRITPMWRRLTLGLRLVAYGLLSTSLPWLYILVRTGARGTLLCFFLGVLFLVHYGVKRLSLRMLLPILIVLYIVLVMYGHVRTELAYRSFGDVLGDAAGRVLSQPALLSPASYGEFSNPARSLYLLANSNVDYWYGRSYFNVVGVLLPRGMFPDRPLTPGEWYVGMVDPAFAAAGGGLGFITAAEGFLNFGYAGVFLHMALFTFALVRLNRRWYYSFSNQGKGYSLVWIAVVFGFLLEAGMRIDVAPPIKTSLFGYAAPLLGTALMDRVLTELGIRQTRRKVYPSTFQLATGPKGQKGLDN